MGVKSEKLKIKLDNLPRHSGVYLMKDGRGKIIYIGKARDLRSRVLSYFRTGGTIDRKTAVMVDKIGDIDFLVTDSEVEALILEANLVKEHKPRYNVSLRDDKRFPYLKLTVDEVYPRLLVTRRVARDGARYFGPYTNVTGMRRTLRFLLKHFGLRTCAYEIPPPPGRTYKVCLDYHIGRCAGACVGEESPEEYRKHVDAVILFLSGRQTDLIEDLRWRMQAASDRLRFEEAARLRDTAEAMESVRRQQKVDSREEIDRDVLAYAREGGDAVAVALQIRQGILIGRRDFRLTVDRDEDDPGLATGFIKQYYHHADNLPEEIFLPVEIDDTPLMEQWLSKLRGARVRFVTPRKGEKVQLVAMAETNARLVLDEILLQKRKYRERIPASAAALRKALGLEKAPLTVGCFDVSNLGRTDQAASFAFFEKGKPKKKEYRHFRVKTVPGQDDYAAMREVISRYLRRCREEKRPLPDLVMVDGGPGQLSAAVDLFNEYSLADHPVIGLAKRLEEVYIPGKTDPVHIPKNSPALNLLKRVRDEAHRFALSYHRRLRSKRTITSELDAIPGIGETRRQALLKHFGSVQKIRAASVEELAGVKSIPRKLAQVIYDHFHQSETTSS